MNTTLPTGKPVKVHIRSEITDLILAEMVASAGEGQYLIDEETGEPRLASELEGEIKNVIEYSTEGILSSDDKTVSVSYAESENMGFDDARTALSYERKSPGVVTMVRTGSASAVCRFDPASPRQLCSFDTGIIPIEVAMNLNSLKNRLTEDGGSILLDYTVEMRGVKTERTCFSIETEPLK